MLINSNFIIAFLLTIIIEVIVALVLGYRKRGEIIAIVFINIITNPILNYFLSLNNYLGIIQINQIMILLLEIIIVIVEWLLLRFALQQKSSRLLILSMAMNFCSYLAGFVVFR
jgi:hypothetical protein